MSFDLKIYFLDLIAYVIDGDTFWALMPKALDHSPRLFFRSSDWVSGPKKCDAQNEFCWRDLEYEELRLGSITGSLELDRTEQGSFPDPGDNQFSWVTPMSKMIGSHPGHVKEFVLHGNATGTVTSRFKLTTGKIKTRHFSAYQWPNFDSRQIYSYEFTDEGLISGNPVTFHSNMPHRALANCVVATIRVTGDRVNIKSFDYMGNENMAKELILHPMNDPNVVEVAYLNEGPNEHSFLGFTTDPKGADLKHFKYFYKLVEGWGSLPEQREFYPHRVSGGDRLPSGRIDINARGLPPIACGIIKVKLARLLKELNSNSGIIERIRDFVKMGLLNVTADLEACPHVLLEPPRQE